MSGAASVTKQLKGDLPLFRSRVTLRPYQIFLGAKLHHQFLKTKAMHPLASAPETEHKMPKPQVQHVENLQMDPQAQPVSRPSTTGSENGEFWPLSGRAYFHVIVIKTHLKPLYQMVIPSKMHPVLPRATIPVVLCYRGKNWETVYSGDRSNKRFDSNWKTFAVDNDLKFGDACVFELMECNSKNLKFRVQILRGDFPSELLARVNGETSNTPIVID